MKVSNTRNKTPQHQPESQEGSSVCSSCMHHPDSQSRACICGPISGNLQAYFLGNGGGWIAHFKGCGREVRMCVLDFRGFFPHLLLRAPTSRDKCFSVSAEK